MSSENIAIKVSALSKVYPLYDTPRNRLKEALHPLRKKYHTDFYALKDVSFEIQKGETVGIIGQNGSGKSTLLKILARVLTPSGGSCTVNGKVSSLLELGTGFNPELSGIENVYFNGTLLGFTKEEMDAKLDDILGFADIGEFVKQPVKTYSSGMYVRLAFAVAINVEPDILIIDEALSVGDEMFQRKCYARIEAIRNIGVTILFVSHSGGTIVELCDRAMLFDGGERLASGLPKQIVGYYQKLLYAPSEKKESIRDQIRNKENNLLPEPEHIDEVADETLEPEESGWKESYDPYLIPQSTIVYESHGAIIESPGIYTIGGEQVNNLISGKTYLYSYKVRFDKNATQVRFGMMIKTINGIELGGGSTAKLFYKDLKKVNAGTIYQVEWKFQCNLNQGAYFLNAGVMGSTNSEVTFLHRIADNIMFKVMPTSESISTGIVVFDCFPEIEIIKK